MFLFTSRLYRVEKKGQREYSALAMEYVRSFDSKWLQGRIVPLGRKDLLTFLVAAAIPFLPLLLLVLPIQDLIKGVWKMLL